jgi:hypothetical protein
LQSSKWKDPGEIETTRDSHSDTCAGGEFPFLDVGERRVQSRAPHANARAAKWTEKSLAAPRPHA